MTPGAESHGRTANALAASHRQDGFTGSEKAGVMSRNELSYEREFSHRQASHGIDAWLWNELPDDLIGVLGDDPKVFCDEPAAQVLKSGPRTSIIRSEWQDALGKKWRLIIKKFRERPYPLGFERLRLRSRAMQNLQAALLLRHYGIATARPLAVLEQRKRGRLDHSYYVSEEIEESVQLRTVWKTLLRKRSEPEYFRKKRALLRRLAELIAKMHGSKLYHPDLKDSNILMRPKNDDKHLENEQFVLVDLDRLRQEKTLPSRKRTKNLMQICRTRYLTDRDKLFFLKIYAERLQLTSKNRRVLNRSVIALCRNEETKRKYSRNR
jgi:tRNA A-37 threonylcarbamoyl transferase component Bud32